MKKKLFNSLGIMSGTSIDGLDLSVIQTDGDEIFYNINDLYFEFPLELRQKLRNLKEKINNLEDLKNFNNEIVNVEREYTIFSIKKISQIVQKEKVDLIGFHGQTIFHSPKAKRSIQLGDCNLISQLSNKEVIGNFRQNDINLGGEGAPLTPIFHNLISKIKLGVSQKKNSIYIINIGGITNITKIDRNFDENLMEGYDIGPGNCLIDEWINRNSKLKFDKDGEIAKSGTINKQVLDYTKDNFTKVNYQISLDTKDFDINFVRGLDLYDGCATLTEFTSSLIADGIKHISKLDERKSLCIFCGGGRKNNHLINSIKKNLGNDKKFLISNIDEYEINGDFVESQAFGYLAVRSKLQLPISFPKTTRCSKPSSGGEKFINF